MNNLIDNAAKELVREHLDHLQEHHDNLSPARKAELRERFSRLPQGRYEQIEKLEQLRVLENGFEIACDVTEDPTIGVDTPEDAVKFEALLG